jgi:hypothetical protein
LLSTRTLFGAGLAIIAIVSLATVVLVQQMALQRISGHTETQFSIITHEQVFYYTQTLAQWVTQTVTQQAAGTTTTQVESTTSMPAGTPYVLVKYYGWTNSSGTSIGYCNPSPGHALLAANITIENDGYDGVYINPFDFYAVIGTSQYKDSFYSTCVGDMLDSVSLLNGLSVTGWIVYEVPSNFNYGAFHLIWDHPIDINVQYQKS